MGVGEEVLDGAGVAVGVGEAVGAGVAVTVGVGEGIAVAVIVGSARVGVLEGAGVVCCPHEDKVRIKRSRSKTKGKICFR